MHCGQHAWHDTEHPCSLLFSPLLCQCGAPLLCQCGAPHCKIQVTRRTSFTIFKVITSTMLHEHVIMLTETCGFQIPELAFMPHKTMDPMESNASGLTAHTPRLCFPRNPWVCTIKRCIPSHICILVCVSVKHSKTKSYDAPPLSKKVGGLPEGH